MPKTSKTSNIVILADTEKPAEKRKIGVDTRFQPGNHMGGRPKTLLTTTLREIFTPEHARAVAQRIIDKSVSGDLRFIELLYGRLEGKIVERRESGQPGSFDQAIEMVETDALLAMIKEIGRRQANKTPNETQSHDSDANRT